MNKTLLAGAVCLLITATSPAFAGSTTDLTVKGKIVPSACTPSFIAGGTVDLGKISVKDLSATQRTQLTKVTVQMKVDCEASTLFALKTTDNRADSGEYGAFGMGLASGGQKIGGYQMSVEKSTADDVVAYPRESTNGDRWSGMEPYDGWMPGILVGFSPQKDSTPPVPMQNVLTEISLYPFILPTNTLPVAEEIEIDGLATFTVTYL